jgi:hypothetical protein
LFLFGRGDVLSFNLVEDISVILETVVTGVVIKSELSANDDNCIAVIQTGGYDSIHTFSGGDSTKQKPVIIQPSFQIVCRSLDRNTILTWWDSIKGILDGKVNYIPSGKSLTYLVIKQSGEIISLGRDDNRRHLESLDFDTNIYGAF